MKKIALIFLIGFLSSSAIAQIPEFDKLEMLYAQKHYKIVYRKATNLLDIPDYDFSLLPNYYKSISLFQLCQNERYLTKHPSALKQAKELFVQVKSSSDGKKIFTAHQNEIAFLKADLLAWSEQLRKEKNNETFDQLQLIMKDLFDFVPTIDSDGQVKEVRGKEITRTGILREDMVNYAKTYIGTPYLWAGIDPNGFDCSGYTGYVMKEFNITTPRRAAEMQKECIEVKRKNVQKGDLVFFDNGSGISHVGMIISEKDAPLVMIHSSTSKGVIVTEIDKSEYWMNRIHSFGTFIK